MKDSTYYLSDGSLNVQRVREDFPIFSRIDYAYLDNSATSQKPQCVIDAVTEYYQSYNANPMRGLYEISIKATDAYEEARKSVAEFIHASKSEEVIFTRNASESLNLAAFSLGELLLSEGDEIITSVEEHHSNFLPWQHAAKRHGAVLKVLEVEKDGTMSPEKLEELITDRTKIVALSHMSNLFGALNDAAAFAKIAHAHGAVLVLDGAQSVPHVDVDVQDLDVDFLAFSAHKMLGPMGIGVLYGKMALLKKMPPFLTGGEMISSVTLKKTVYAEVPHKFEAGTVNAGDAIAFAAALRYMKELGFDKMQQREEMLTKRAVEGIKKIPFVTLVGSDDPAEHHGILTFKIEGVHPHDIATIFDAHKIAVRAGHHCAQPLHQHLGIPSTTRASLMFYNTEEEVDRFLEVLSGIRSEMGYEDSQNVCQGSCVSCDIIH